MHFICTRVIVFLFLKVALLYVPAYRLPVSTSALFASIEIVVMGNTRLAWLVSVVVFQRRVWQCIKTACWFLHRGGLWEGEWEGE
jgi:hypothetical protein